MDFLAADETDVGFVGDVRNRPEETSDLTPALYLQGANVSGDLFMYWSRMIDGFLPDAEYTIGMDIAVPQQARARLHQRSWRDDLDQGRSHQRRAGRQRRSARWSFRLNIDKGDHALGGATVLTLGDLRTNAVGCSPTDHTPPGGDAPGKTPSGSGPTRLGQLWLIVGIESTAAGTIDIYHRSPRGPVPAGGLMGGG